MQARSCKLEIILALQFGYPPREGDQRVWLAPSGHPQTDARAGSTRTASRGSCRTQIPCKPFNCASRDADKIQVLDPCWRPDGDWTGHWSAPLISQIKNAEPAPLRLFCGTFPLALITRQKAAKQDGYSLSIHSPSFTVWTEPSTNNLHVVTSGSAVLRLSSKKYPLIRLQHKVTVFWCTSNHWVFLNTLSESSRGKKRKKKKIISREALTTVQSRNFFSVPTLTTTSFPKHSASCRSGAFSVPRLTCFSTMLSWHTFGKNLPFSDQKLKPKRQPQILRSKRWKKERVLIGASISEHQPCSPWGNLSFASTGLPHGPTATLKSTPPRPSQSLLTPSRSLAILKYNNYYNNHQTPETLKRKKKIFFTSIFFSWSFKKINEKRLPMRGTAHKKFWHKTKDGEKKETEDVWAAGFFPIAPLRAFQRRQEWTACQDLLQAWGGFQKLSKQESKKKKKKKQQQLTLRFEQQEKKNIDKFFERQASYHESCCRSKQYTSTISGHIKKSAVKRVPRFSRDPLLSTLAAAFLSSPDRAVTNKACHWEYLYLNTQDTQPSDYLAPLNCAPSSGRFVWGGTGRKI